jgi:hypothetical protein
MARSRFQSIQGFSDAFEVGLWLVGLYVVLANAGGVVTVIDALKRFLTCTFFFLQGRASQAPSYCR